MRPRGTDFVIGELLTLAAPVTLYDGPNLTGQSLPLGIGERRFFTPEDFNDRAISIHVEAGHVAMLFQHADEAGGFGISVDLMEDCADLSSYGLSQEVSYVSVFSATNQTGHIWVRGKGSGDSYVAGHWERPRASGESPNDTVGAVSPPLPSRAPGPKTTVAVSGSVFHITSLGPQDPTEASLWDYAVSNQFGVLGSDYRGPEPIGSAAFERDPNDWLMSAAHLDNLNFWYPQKQPRDHRSEPYFKRTCIGTVDHVDVATVAGTYIDHDVDIYITPDERHEYLISQGHPREYTDIMYAQYKAKQAGLTSAGQESCDDEESIRDFGFVEAEIHPSSDLASGVAEGLRDRIRANTNGTIGVYGSWIYDKGHCCHAEVHPAEQIWWRVDTPPTTTYHLNVICDASKRFWWRDQMDGDDKRKPWGAPPITGVYAIAFEVALPGPTVTGPLEFVVSEVSRLNAATKTHASEILLVYEGATLVKFVPGGDALAGSFEHVGLGDNGLVRGFLVLEATVGSVSQITVDEEFPAGTDINSVSEEDERKVFDKLEGRYMFTLAQRKADDLVVSG
jgi:hypothetical protein